MTNLNLNPDTCSILWKVRGLQWSNLYYYISQLYLVWPTPLVLIIHLSGNNVGHMKTLDLGVRHDLHHFKMSSPNTTIVFSDINPRLLWLSHPEFKNFKKIRKRVNHSIEKFMPLIGGFFLPEF